MVSVRQLSALIGLALLIVLASSGCSAERLLAREALADPLMRFAPARVIDAPGTTRPGTKPPTALPTDTVRMDTEGLGFVGGQQPSAGLTSEVRTAVEIAAGFGLEAGYGLGWERQRIWKLDGFAGPLTVERLRHGPDGALVYDDGTSVLRAGYSYRTAWDGDRHEPSVLARTAVLSRDTVIELGYRHTRQQVRLMPEHLATEDEFSARQEADWAGAAIEQGFVPGWNLRLEAASLVERGLLHSPYRSVSLWSHRPLTSDEPLPEIGPTVLPEHHPDSRLRWGTLLRVRKSVPALGAVFELGAGHGAGNWRVEHSEILLGYRQRLGDLLAFDVRGGVYHQTRAIFYRDDYPEGPGGLYWSADRELCSYLAFWGEAGVEILLFAERGRLLGMFRSLALEIGARTARMNTNFEGIRSANGFSRYSSLGATTGRAPFDGGWGVGGWLSLEAAF